jgi:hypothetical protein
MVSLGEIPGFLVDPRVERFRLEASSPIFQNVGRSLRMECSSYGFMRASRPQRFVADWLGAVRIRVISARV